ncbi:PA domain-containing protein, partial [Lysobacter sp. 2RAB21]
MKFPIATPLAVLCAAVLSMPAIAAKPAKAPKAPKAPVFDTKRLSEEVKVLSSDEFEGRGPATAGETKTIDYVVAQLKAAGVQPGGELKDGKRLWTQPVPLLRAEIAGTPSLSVSVKKKARALTQGNEIAVRAALDGSTNVAIKNAPLVFAGYGITAPERQWDDFKNVDLKGKIAIVLINDPDFESGQGDFGGKAMTYYGRWTYKFEEAARQGAKAALIIHDTAGASYGWEVVKNSWSGAQFDLPAKDDPEPRLPVQGWITNEAARKLLGDLGQNLDQLYQAAGKRGFKAIALQAKASVDLKSKISQKASRNVIARLD